VDKGRGIPVIFADDLLLCYSHSYHRHQRYPRCSSLHPSTPGHAEQCASWQQSCLYHWLWPQRELQRRHKVRTLTNIAHRSVSNPNWFNVDFSKITAKASYPGVNGDLGGGTLYNVNFKGHTASTFDFPFTFK
jgi:hypothetical protein